MIPKVIHYCWFGGNEIPELEKKCIESWKKYCPDYKIIEWNESNFDVESNVFAKEAMEEKQWAFVSDVARLQVVFQEGGVYLDTDVELIRPLDDLLENRCFLAEEYSGYVGTALGFGAEKGNPIVGEMLQQYQGHFKLAKGIFDVVPSPRKNTAPLYKYGYRFSGKQIWKTEHAIVYPVEYFCPLNRETGELNRTKNTYSIHYFSALWIPDDLKLLNRQIGEMEKQNAPFIAFLKRLKMKYVYYKGKGEVKSLPGYIVWKLKQKILMRS